MPRGIPRDSSTNRKIVHLLKISRGHLDKVISMAQKGEYCIDIVHQSLAVQSALRSIDNKLLKHHMETCVAESIKNGNSKEVLSEVMKVMEKQ